MTNSLKSLLSNALAKTEGKARAAEEAKIRRGRKRGESREARRQKKQKRQDRLKGLRQKKRLKRVDPQLTAKAVRAEGKQTDPSETRRIVRLPRPRVLPRPRRIPKPERLY